MEEFTQFDPVGAGPVSYTHLHGDVNFAQVEPVVKAITPVPGGVGAVTSTVLSAHTVEAALRANGLTGKENLEIPE